MDISSKSRWPAGSLSNFAPHPFIFEGEQSNSMEGFLQSLKFSDEDVAREVRLLVGLAAKRRGQKRNKAWKSVQTLWWKGDPMPRKSKELALVVDCAFEAMFVQSSSARRALIATGNAVLTHSMGARKKSDTVLTSAEFCSRLMRIRSQILGA